MKKFLIGGVAAAALVIGSAALADTAQPAKAGAKGHDAHAMKAATRAEVAISVRNCLEQRGRVPGDHCQLVPEHDFRWLELPVLDQRGDPVQGRSVTGDEHHSGLPHRATRRYLLRPAC